MNKERVLHRLGFTYRLLLSFSPLNLSMDSLKMLWLFYRVGGYTMVGVPRLKALYKLTKESDLLAIPGDIVECGVYNGGSAAVMAYASNRSAMNRRIWLFDSFKGLPKPIEEDGIKALEGFHEGWRLGHVSKVKEIFSKLSIPEDRVRVIEGWFQGTFPSIDIPQICLLHIDADWYESVKLCLEKFYDCVQPRGFIVLDDYGQWEGCRRATDEFIQRRNLNVKLTQVDYTGHYFQKPGIGCLVLE